MGSRGRGKVHPRCTGIRSSRETVIFSPFLLPSPSLSSSSSSLSISPNHFIPVSRRLSVWTHFYSDSLEKSFVPHRSATQMQPLFQDFGI